MGAAMYFTYVGDPRDHGSGPETLTAHGIAFPKGVPVPVGEDIAAKLSGNSHFSRADDVAPPVPAADPAPKRRGRPPRK